MKNVKIKQYEKRYADEEIKTQEENRDTEENTENTENTEPKDNVIVGYALKFNSETTLFSDKNGEVREIILKESLDNVDLSNVVLLFDHENLPLAHTKNGTLKLEIDDVGLRFEAHLNDTARQEEVYNLVKKGYITKTSFGFKVDEDGDEWVDTKVDNRYITTRVIKKFKRILDVSLVSIPAYEETEVEARSIIHQSIHQANQQTKKQKQIKELEKYFEKID